MKDSGTKEPRGFVTPLAALLLALLLLLGGRLADSRRLLSGAERLINNLEERRVPGP